MRDLLRPDDPSELFLDHGYEGKVQDAYSLRCTPQVPSQPHCMCKAMQVHGVAHDTLNFVRSLLNVELNSATDNPMVFTAKQVRIPERASDLSPSHVGSQVEAAPPLGFTKKPEPPSAPVTMPPQGHDF